VKMRRNEHTKETIVGKPIYK